MNTTTMRTLIAAAALVVAGTASAQTFKAEVPMAFQVAGKTMNPGTYEIRMKDNGNGEVIALYSRGSGSSALAVAGVTADAPKAWREAGLPKIAFENHGGTYLLRTLWTAEGVEAHQFTVPKTPNGVISRTELVTLAMVKVH